MRTWLRVLAAVLACAPPLPAQRVWRSSFYPFIYYSTIDGVWGGGHAGISAPIGFRERPEEHSAAFNFDAGASTGGSYRLVADAKLPAYWDGWRFAATAAAGRDNRLGFYGLGNDSPYSADNITTTAPFFYRVSRAYQSGRLTVQRRLIGPLRVMLGAAIERTDFRTLPGANVFHQDLVGGVIDSSRIPFVDRTVRTGLIFDTRDNELDPHAGVLLEALYAGGPGYTRTTGSARVFAHPFPRLVILGRMAGERLGGDPPLAVQFNMESTERAFVAVGGYRSLRGFYDARFVGPGKLLGGVEARYAMVRVPSVMEVVLGAFLDAGRVFGPGEAFRVTTTGLHSSGGGEIGVRFLRNSLLVLGVAAGAEGTQLLFATQWSY